MLSDLIFVLEHISKILKEYDLVALYTNYANTLQAISESSTPELQEQLKNYLDRIKEAHEQLDSNGWSNSQMQVFEHFGAKRILGNNGYRNFLSALNNNAANVAGAIQEINIQREEISQLLNNAANILNSLGGLNESSKPKTGQAIIEVVFDEDVAINNIVELASQSESWSGIIRAFSLLAKSAPENTTIVATNKSNPLSLWMSTLPLISKAFYHTVKPFIDLWSQVLMAKEHALALEDQKIMVAKKKFELFKDIDEFETKKVLEIVELTADNHHDKSLTASELNHAKAALIQAGPELYNFITKGGKVDTTKEGEGNGISGNFQFEPEYRKTHTLRNNVQKLLMERDVREKEEAEKIEKEKLKKEKEGRKKISVKKKEMKAEEVIEVKPAET